MVITVAGTMLLSDLFDVTAPVAILVIGEADADRDHRVAVLSDAGYSVGAANSIAAALAGGTLETSKLVILDRLSQAEAASSGALKVGYPYLFVLHTCGDVDDIVAEDPAVDAFLLEPVDKRELLTLTRSLLRLQQVEAKLRDSERRLELAQESAGLAILDWDIATNRFIHSAMFATLFDLPERAPGQPLASGDLIGRIHPEDLGAILSGFSTEEARSFEQEYRIVRKDGSIRWIASRGRFLLGRSGIVERMISLSFDVTARRESERRNAQLASIVASSTDAIVSIDGAGRIVTWNTGAERLFEFTAAEMIGQSFDGVLTDGDGSQARADLPPGDAWEIEVQQTTKTGRRIDIAVNSAPMRSLDGTVLGASLIMRDIAPQKKREDHIRFLMRELAHRSKNLLAVIQAMARQSLNKEIAPDEFVKRFSNRLAGLAGSHDLLSSVDWRGVSLVDLIRSQLRHYEDLFETQITLQGVDITIRPEAAQNIGIALHELSTNAAKYGALSDDKGHVSIAWHVASADGETPARLHLTWRESDGPVVNPPTRRGFGHVVMGRVAGQALAGTSNIQFLPEGVVWTLIVPAPTVLYVEAAGTSALDRSLGSTPPVT